jgi:hypothetical protein
MLKLSAIDPYDTQFNHRVIGDINFDTKSIIELKLSQLALNQPYRLDISFNSNFPYAQEFRNDPVNHGLKIQTDYVNLGFVVADGKRQLGLQTTYTLFSSSQKLARSVSYPDQTFIGTLSDFLSNLSQDFIYTAISPEPNTFLIETAGKNDLELLTEAVSRVDFFAWRENGLVDIGGGVLKPEILYGNFGRDINTYYNLNPAGETECKPLEAFKTTGLDDSYNPNIVQIDNIEENFSVNYYNRLFIFVDTGQGLAVNSRLPVVPSTVEPNFGVEVNPQFPLLPVVKQGKVYYYLQVPNVPAFPIHERYLSYSSSANTEDGSGVIQTTPAQSTRRAYQDGINYARSQISANYFSIKRGDLKRICLPGNLINVAYTENAENGIVVNSDYVLSTIKDLDLTIIKN